MKRDEVLKFFPEATDEQIDGILNQVGSELNPLKASLADITAERDQGKAALATAQTEAASYKTQLEEANAKLKEGMTAEELMAQREKDAAEKERDFTLKSNALDAKAIFVGSGYFDEEEIEGLVTRVTTEDSEGTKAFAQSIVDTVKKQREAAEQSTKDELLRGNPHLGGAGGSNAITKEKFDKLDYEEQRKLVEENPDLLKSFTQVKNPYMN